MQENGYSKLLEDMVSLGRLPTDEEASQDSNKYHLWESALGKFTSPVSDAQAVVLAKFFPTDESDSYGLAWTLLHLIESAPSWPLDSMISAITPYWRGIISKRISH